LVKSRRSHPQERLVRGKMITRYEIDGNPVTATIANVGFPRFYAVRIGDGPVRGYVQRSALSHEFKAYLGSAEPDALGAQRLEAYETLRAAIERVVREAISGDESPESS
jgi:hypothetical protein